MDRRVLIAVEDEEVSRRVKQEVAGEGMRSVAVSEAGGLLRAIADEEPAAVVLDERIGGGAGRDVLDAIHADHPWLPVVWLAASADRSSIHKGLAGGATDFVPLSESSTRLVTSVKNAVARGRLERRVRLLTEELREGEGMDRILGESEAIRETIRLLERAATQDVPVLLEGEVGTGREHAARAIHAGSRRRGAPFVTVPCEAFAPGRLEAVLFGIESSGSGAHAVARRGRMEAADGGTCFLSEIGTVGRGVQEGLIHLLRERVVPRVGGLRLRETDVRILAATSRDLREAAAGEAFSRELYDALAVFPIRMPPLRERGGDVAILAEAFCKRFAARHRRSVTGIEEDTMRILEGHDWPGNVGELERTIERAVLLETGSRLSVASLPREIVAVAGRQDHRALSLLPLVVTSKEDIVCFDEEERRIILRALELTGWNVQEAAQRLGIGRATIYRKIDRYDLRRFRPRRLRSLSPEGSRTA